MALDRRRYVIVHKCSTFSKQCKYTMKEHIIGSLSHAKLPLISGTIGLPTFFRFAVSVPQCTNQGQRTNQDQIWQGNAHLKSSPACQISPDQWSGYGSPQSSKYGICRYPTTYAMMQCCLRFLVIVSSPKKLNIIMLLPLDIYNKSSLQNLNSAGTMF